MVTEQGISAEVWRTLLNYRVADRLHTERKHQPTPTSFHNHWSIIITHSNRAKYDSCQIYGHSGPANHKGRVPESSVS